MASTLQKLLSTLLFLSTVLSFSARSSAQECPYPCYPPPTGAGNSPPATTTPPSPPAGGSFSPPVSYSPPIGVVPYLPPPGYATGQAPPPPDPILPWFPYYYRKPRHADQSSSTTLKGSSKTMIITIPFLVLTLFFCFPLSFHQI